MGKRQIRRIGRPVRWLLLLSTVFGLAIMHTLGHSGMYLANAGHAGGHEAASLAAMDEPASVAAGLASTMIAAGCASSDCGGHGAMDGWTACVAVLSGLVIVVLFGVALQRRRRGTGADGSLFGMVGVPRPPPVSAAGKTVACMVRLRI